MTELDWSSTKPVGGNAQPGAQSDLDWSETAPVNGNSPPPTPPVETGTYRGVAENLAGGLNNAIDTTLGAPVDISRTAINLGIGGYNKLTGSDVAPIPDDSFGGRQSIAKALGHVGVTDPDTIEAHGTVEKLARAAGEGAGYMVAPEALIGALGKLGVVGPKLAEVLGTIFGKSEGTADVTKNAAIGAIGGAGGEAASEAAPDPLKPLAGMVGSIAAGGLGAASGEIATRVLAKPAQEALASLPEKVLGIRTGSKSAQQRRAGDYLQNAMTNPAAVQKKLDYNAGPIIEGSKPLSRDVADDPGLSVLSGVIERATPEEFVRRFDENNVARETAIRGAQPEGRGTAVAEALRSQREDIDGMLQAQHEQAVQNLTDQQAGFGNGEDNPAAAERLRTAMQTADDAAEEQQSRLWEGIDPGHRAQAIAAPIKTAREHVYGNMTPEKEIGLTAPERAIDRVVSAYGDTIPLRNLIDLRSRLSTEMRNAQSPMTPNSEAYGRLSQLRGAVEDAIDASVAGQVQSDERQVAAGTLAPEDTIYANMLRQMEEWRASRNAEGNATRADSGNGVGPSGRRGAASAAGPSRTNGTPGGGLPGDAGAEAVSGELIDPEAARRLREASDFTRNLKATQGAEPVRDILKRSGPAYPYNLAPSGVASKAWQPGEKGAESIGALLAQSGRSPETMTALTSIAANSLRDSVGTRPLTADALQTWRTKYAGALRALDEAVPGTAARFDNMAAAADHLATVADIRRQATESMETGALGKLLNVSDEQDVRKTVEGILGAKTAVRDVRQLVRTIGNDPEAMNGLRKTVVDIILDKARSTSEAGPSGSRIINADPYIKFIDHNADALSEVFGDEDMALWRALGRELGRTTRTVNGRGQSPTKQFAEAAKRFKEVSPGEQRRSLLESLIGRVGAVHPLAALTGGTLFLSGGGLYPAVAGALGAEVVARMREAGIKNINDLIRNAMLDPKLLKTLLMAAPKKPGVGSAVTLAQRLAKIGLVGTARKEPIQITVRGGATPATNRAL